MRFNLKEIQVEVEPYPGSSTKNGTFRVIKGNEFIQTHQGFSISYLKKHFKPADCEALDLVDPDRNERLSK